MVKSLRFRVQGLGLGCRLQGWGVGVRVEDLEWYGVYGSGFRVEGLGFRV